MRIKRVNQIQTAFPSEVEQRVLGCGPEVPLSKLDCFAALKTAWERTRNVDVDAIGLDAVAPIGGPEVARPVDQELDIALNAIVVVLTNEIYEAQRK